MALATAAALTAGTWAAAAYVDAKYHIRKDLQALERVKQGKKEYAQAVNKDKISLWYPLEDQCKNSWARRALWFKGHEYTYGDLYQQSLRYAQWLLEQGVRPGDLVALYLINSPDFFFAWFGLMAIGAGPAFINYHLEGDALLHCLELCQAKLLIADADAACQQRINDSRAAIEGQGMKIAVVDDQLQREIASKAPLRPGDEMRNGTPGSFPYCLIYTSGTTGLPKASAFTMERVWLMCGHNMPHCEGVPGKDQWYNPMPLYHGTGSITTSLCMIQGLAVSLAPKFSVSKFWDDVYDSEATIFIYVGETVRYLLNSPPHPHDQDHKLRCAYGNGLKPDVWRKFQKRFNVPQIGEFFNSTEGMFALMNFDKGPFLEACVGHHGLILRRMMHNVYMPVKSDHETGDIWRDPKTGFAQRTPYEEGGEILVAVPNKAAWQGYWRSEEATDKRFCHNVFKKGDLYYRSGDALRRDSEGRWHFMDRLGDTFRWKSENVSTEEVALTMCDFPGISEANVYGVLVPNHEGRAGCAAITLEATQNPETFDFDGLLKYTRARLPRYAVPVFLRMVRASSHIHNNKQNKVPLRKEGIDPTLVGTEAPEGKDDRFLWIPPKGERYERFTDKEWDAIKQGQVKL